MAEVKGFDKARRSTCRGTLQHLLDCSSQSAVAKSCQDFERLPQHFHVFELGVQILAHSGDELHCTQRLSSELEEVVVQAHFFEFQNLFPQQRQLPLRCRFRGPDVACAQDPLLREHRLRQGTPVHFHVVVQRQGIELDVACRHHVVGQVLHHVSPDRGNSLVRALRGAGGVGDDVRDQELLARRCGLGHHHAVAHAGCLAQVVFDFADLDAHAAHIDLEVVAAQNLQPAVLAQPPHVSGAVEAPPRDLDELLRCQLGPVQVALDDARAGKVDLADDANRNGLELGVEQPDRHVVEGPADEGACDRRMARNRVGATHAADFAAAVDDEHLGLAEDLLERLQHFGRDHVATGGRVPNAVERSEVGVALSDVGEHVLQQAWAGVEECHFAEGS